MPTNSHKGTYSVDRVVAKGVELAVVAVTAVAMAGVVAC